MDPVARRKIRELVSLISSKRSVILTTHSMEEAEALCSRITIMIDGQMQCIGGVQQLKESLLGGYKIDLQCKYSAPDSVVDMVQKQILRSFPGCMLLEHHGRFLRFGLPDLSCSGIGIVFRKLRTMKSDHAYMVDDYSVSQCTLEQVFINLTKDAYITADLNKNEGF